MDKIKEIGIQALLEENRRLKEENLRQREQIAVLMQRLALLEERLQQNSRNSSKPPSGDGPAVGKQSREPTGRKRGGQVGHPGTKRELLPPDEVDETVELKPEVCTGCGQELEGEDAHPYRHQVTEIPPIRPQVTEYRLHLLVCPCCGTRNHGQLPEGVSTGAFGPRLQGMVALCTGVYRLSKRTVLSLLSDMLGVEMALGSVSGCEKAVSRALSEPVEEALEYVREQKVANADETGWREAKKRAWLWVAVTSLVTVFMIHASRGKKAANQLLEGFCGVLITDRWVGYNDWPLERRQFCWAHLLREFRAMSERKGASARVGKGLLEAAGELFDLWHGFREGQWGRRALQSRADPLREKVEELLTEGAACSHKKTAGTCRQLLKRLPALWTFLRVEGVEPTNNAAERAVRPAVLWRKSSFGTDSASGSRFAERIMTVTATCRQQKRNTLEFVVAALRADLVGTCPPSLLPEQQLDTAMAA